MKKNNLQAGVLSIVSILYTAPTYCNIIRWPTKFVVNLLLAAIVIKAVLYYWFLENITYTRVLLISCVGSAASVFSGLYVLDFIPSSSEHLPVAEDVALIGTPVLMYLASCFMELLAIKIIFRYSFKDLWNPVFVGNLVTYIIIYLLGTMLVVTLKIY